MVDSKVISKTLKDPDDISPEISRHEWLNNHYIPKKIRIIYLTMKNTAPVQH